MENNSMIFCFEHLDRKFHLACHHIRMLNRQIEMMQTRYDRSFVAAQTIYRYSHRLKLATYEGMRSMFYEHASRCADQLEQIQDVFIERGLLLESDDSDTETNTL
jgi:hypothetical protein